MRLTAIAAPCQLFAALASATGTAVYINKFSLLTPDAADNVKSIDKVSFIVDDSYNNLTCSAENLDFPSRQFDCQGDYNVTIKHGEKHKFAIEMGWGDPNFDGFYGEADVRVKCVADADDATLQRCDQKGHNDMLVLYG